MDKPQVGDQLHTQRRPSIAYGGLTHAGRLQAALQAMYASGQDTQDAYNEAVENLKRDPEDMLVAIAAAYGRSLAGDYAQRQALVHAAAVIGHPATLPFLGSVALSEIPAETAGDSHGFSTVAEETIIRTTAADAIAKFAHTGDKRAIDLLVRCVESPSFSLRRAAVFGLMNSRKGKALRPRLKALVPKEQHFIFDLKKTAVRQALQVKDPTRHLAKDHKGYDERKPVIAGSGGDRPTTPTRKRR